MKSSSKFTLITGAVIIIGGLLFVFSDSHQPQKEIPSGNDVIPDSTEFDITFIENYPDIQCLVDSLRDICVNYRKCGEFDKARKEYRNLRNVCQYSLSLIQSEPDSSEKRVKLLYNIAGAFFWEGNYIRASNVLEEVLNETEDLRLLLRMGLRWSFIGNNGNVRKAYQKIVSLAPDSPQAKTAQVQIQHLSEDNKLWEVTKETLNKLEDRNYQEVAVLYKELLDHIAEGNNYMVISRLILMMHRRGDYIKVMMKFLELEGVTLPSHEKIKSVYEADWVFTDFDAALIEKADIASISRVVNRLEKVYKVGGSDALLPAVPTLAEKAMKGLHDSKTFEGPGEAGGELLLNMINLLSKSGAPHAKPVLMEAMCGMRVGGIDMFAKGFLAIGRSTIPEIADSLKSTRSWPKVAIPRVLRRMAVIDLKFFTEEDKKQIKIVLETNLQDKNSKGFWRREYLINSLVVFGNESSIPILEHIKETDTYVHSNRGEYDVRKAAERAIENIRARLK